MAVIEEGSFDAAARRLQITPSAVSQRIKALEQQVGQVLVKRERPCVPAASALPLVRVAAQMALLEAEAIAQLRGGEQHATRISLAVNADSMATWFTGVFGMLGDDVLVEVHIEDQDHSARLLRNGAVMGAVTTERRPIPGRRVHPLGAMRYVPVAGRAFATRFLPSGFTAAAVAHAPTVSWNRDDALQEDFVRKVFRRSVAMPVHYVPTVEGNLAAIQAGLACFRTHCRRTVSLSGSATTTSTCRCTGSAGSWTRCSSPRSPMPCGRPPRNSPRHNLVFADVEQRRVRQVDEPALGLVCARRPQGVDQHAQRSLSARPTPPTVRGCERRMPSPGR